MTGPARKQKLRPYGSHIAVRHAAYLRERAVSPTVAKERGYRTVENRSSLAQFGFPAANTPGLLMPVLWGDEVVLHQHRPDEPRVDEQGKPQKFERPTGKGNRLDCHPRMTPRLADASVPLWITEGVTKGDALVSAGLCAVALLGVDNWRGTRADGTKGVLADWDDVALGGRTVYLAFDSDCMTKQGVERARQNLTSYLVEGGALVRWVYLPGGEAKVGVDDYLAADHTADDLLALARVPHYRVATNARQLHDTTREAITALAVTNDPPVIFQRMDVLAEARTAGVAELTRDRLRYRLGEKADWYRPTKDAAVPVAPPDDVVKNVAVAEDLWPFPVLDRIVTTPVFAADGSLRTEPGYHPASRSLYVPPQGLDVPPVKERPTAKDTARTCDVMEDLFHDFVFVDDADRAHAWALLLQPFARELVRGFTPLFAWRPRARGPARRCSSRRRSRRRSERSRRSQSRTATTRWRSGSLPPCATPSRSCSSTTSRGTCSTRASRVR